MSTIAEQDLDELNQQLKKFVKKLDIENNSGINFRIWLTNEQVYNT